MLEILGLIVWIFILAILAAAPFVIVFRLMKEVTRTNPALFKWYLFVSILVGLAYSGLSYAISHRLINWWDNVMAYPYPLLLPVWIVLSYVTMFLVPKRDSIATIINVVVSIAVFALLATTMDAGSLEAIQPVLSILFFTGLFLVTMSILSLILCCHSK